MHQNYTTFLNKKFRTVINPKKVNSSEIELFIINTIRTFITVCNEIVAR